VEEGQGFNLLLKKQLTPLFFFFIHSNITLNWLLPDVCTNPTSVFYVSVVLYIITICKNIIWFIEENDVYIYVEEDKVNNEKE